MIGYADLPTWKHLQKVIQKLAFKDSEAKKTIPPDIQYTKAGHAGGVVDRDEYTMFDFHADYTSGQAGTQGRGGHRL